MSTGGHRIPVCEPYLGTREREYLLRAIDSNWISSAGEFLDAFEEQFARYCGCRHGITTTSGTTALHLAVAAAGIGPGDEVLIPSFTIAACAFAVLYQGARPVLVDVDPDTWTMRPDQLESKITPRTRAIMPVHIYGHPCDMDPILSVARAHDLIVIEDAAEAHGGEYKGRKCGGLGDVGCFSFYANKILTTGEGGMVVTNDDVLAERCRSLRNLAFNNERRYLHDAIGFNYRMTNLQAALGLAQVDRIDEFAEMRRGHARFYTERLSSVPGVQLPVEKEWSLNVFWMYGLLIDGKPPRARDELMARLASHGVETRSFFVPMHEQPLFHDLGLFQRETYPTASDLGERGLYLPSSTGLTESDMLRVVSALELELPSVLGSNS
jgi:perosamine synthetase